MPESYGKRQRQTVKAKKVAAREQRRIARNQRRADRAAGTLEEHAPFGTPFDPKHGEDVPSRDKGAEKRERTEQENT
jgi:hypothetical protein